MSYRIDPDEPLAEEVRLIAREQIDKALAVLDDDSVDHEEAVHDARKRCKKVRALLRLVRPAMEDVYQRENARFRDASKLVSQVRDADVLVETLDTIINDAPADMPWRSQLRERIRHRRDDIRSHARAHDKSQAFIEALRAGRDEVDRWPLGEIDKNTLRAGVKKTYSRGRDAIDDCEDADDDRAGAVYHEWRKRVKYHWYHTRLLRKVSSAKLKSQRNDLDDLADLLGDDHDLSVLRATLLEESSRFGTLEQLAPVLELINRRSRKLRKKAHKLGEDLFDRKPKKQSKRMVS